MTLQPAPILHTRLPFAPWHSPQGHRLPGTGPVAPEDWLRVDEVYGPQMALREQLLQGRPAAVLAGEPQGDAGAELLQAVLDWAAARDDFAVTPRKVTRPDSATVPLDRPRPLATAARLVQQDLCLMQRSGDEHVLTAAALCFPASWTLAEKLGRPLSGIHGPVAVYDAGVAARVQRLFDALRPGVVLARCNCLGYADPALHQPLPERAPRVRPVTAAPYLRLERQTLRLLPVSGAVVFAIHTAVVPRACLTGADAVQAAGA